MEFKNQIAVVTGGSKNIGFAIAQRLAHEGAKVYLLARTLSDLEEAKSKIEEQGGKAEVRSVDVTNTDNSKPTIEKIVDEILEKEGRLDIFVNNAGEYKPTSIDTEYSKAEQTIDLDYKAPFRIAQYLMKKFKGDKNNLKILTTLSHASYRLLDAGAGYGSAKEGAMSALIHLEKELKDKKIKNLEMYRIYPGSVGTESVVVLYRKGIFGAPTTLKSVVDLCVDLLTGKTPTRDAYIGFIEGQGIKRVYFDVNWEGTEEQPGILRFKERVIVDKDFDPEKEFLKRS